MAVAIAKALSIPVGDLAGLPAHRVKLAGEWWASWQTFRDGVEKIATQKVEMQQEGELIGYRPLPTASATRTADTTGPASFACG